MKHYIGSIDVFYDEHCGDTLVALRAPNEAAARELLKQHARGLVGEGAVQEDADDDYFTSEHSMLGTRVVELKEVTAATFDAIAGLVTVLGEPDLGVLAHEPDDERVKTLSRRIGEQLRRLDAPVAHSKVLHAVSASLGETDWQVLLAKSRADAMRPALADFEGLQLWALTGRCYGDDDDSLGLVWAHDLAQAKQAFLRDTLDLDDEDLAAHKEDDPQFFMCCEELMGTVKNGAFEFDARHLTR